MLLREKIVAASSEEEMVVIADETKMVPRLGKFPLPVEVVEFGHKATALRLAAAFGVLGYAGIAMNVRQKDGAPFKTDSGNLIYDCAVRRHPEAPLPSWPPRSHEAMPGVVEHGLLFCRHRHQRC